jgi:transcriptional regulator with XRE-family HTH domain
MRKRRPRGSVFAGYVTRRDIARLLGVSGATISRWEKAGQSPTGIYIAGVKLYKKAEVDAWVKELIAKGIPPASEPMTRKPRRQKPQGKR